MSTVPRSDPSEDELFTYSSVPLPSSTGYIRVLELFPSVSTGDQPSASSYDAPLRCSLCTTPIDQGHTYQALSYTWGEAVFTEQLEIVDHEITGTCKPTSTVLKITPSLDEALRHIRQHKESITLWIDQICINQDASSPEKGAQVRMMGDIYSRASRVLIWLGPGNDDSDKLFQLLGQLADLVRDYGLEQCIGGGMYLPSGAPNREVLEMQSVLFHLNSDSTASSLFVDAFRGFLTRAKGLINNGNQTEEGYVDVAGLLGVFTSRPWFSRVWVLQEFALGRDRVFICGHTSLDVEIFDLGRRAWRTARISAVMESLRRPMGERRLPMDFDDRYNGPISRLLGLAEVYLERGDDMQPPERYKLVDLFRVLHRGDWPQLLSTDPKDRIYSLLGLCSDAETLGLGVPDYSPAMTTAGLFSQVTRRMIETAGDLTVLELVKFPKHIQHTTSTRLEGSGGRNGNELPSWAPDFFGMQHSYAHARVIESRTAAWLFSPTGLDRNPRVLKTGREEDVLGLEGILADTIDQLGEPWLGPDPLSNHRDNTDGYCRFALAVYGLLHSALGNMSTSSGQILDDIEHRLESPWSVMTGGLEILPSGVDDGVQRATAAATGRDMRGFLETCAATADSFSASGFLLRKLLQSLTEFGAAEGRVKPAAPASGFIFDPDESRREARVMNRVDKMRNKRPFLTSSMAYLGMGPLETEPGDCVVAFYGARVMYVVRPVPERGERFFSFVGEAYCDGVMDGEMLDRGVTEEFYLV